MFALMAVGWAREGTTADVEELKEIFDTVLLEEGVTLDHDDYEEKLTIFSLNFLAGSDDDDVCYDMVYTEAELAQMNGAKPVANLKSQLAEELEKRGIDPMADVAKRSVAYYDGRYHNGRVIVNPAVHQGVCGNCYLHTFIAALEIAYAKITGSVVKFSEQEMTDCYNNGCEGGDYKMVAITMSYLDKLSSLAGYGDYLSKQLTCRMDTTPDALKALQVVDFLPVDTSNVEEAIRKYGSVMTCMKWGGSGEVCDMSNYRRGQVVNYPAVEKGCDHAILIVGYTPQYYIVRNSHGKNWGESGYFKIRRNTNSCGIEQDMAALVTKGRSAKPGLVATGCPANKPYLCTKINTCTAVRSCTTAISEQEEIEIVAEEEVVEELLAEKEEEVVEEEIEEREAADDEEIQLEKREVRIPGERKKRDEEERKKKRTARIPGKLQRMLEKRGASSEDLDEYFDKRTDEDEEVEVEKRCADRSSVCGRMKAMGKLDCNGRYLQFCPKSCNKCSAAVAPAPKASPEKQGKCIRPTILNGRAGNKPVMQAGEKLNVRCNAGYTLIGEAVTCQIQNVFTNKDKDARLVPGCIRLGSNTLVGNGASYSGSKNTYGVGQMSFTCDSWNKDVLRGILMNKKDGMALAIGNHNYCRNPGGAEPVPFCIGSGTGVGKIHYCFGHAGCNTCAGAADNYGADYCGSARNLKYCLYTDESSAARVSAIQANCAATCCAIAGC